MPFKIWVSCVLFLVVFASTIMAGEPRRPVPLIFDTDIGNDCDDVLALGMSHALQSRGECKLLAVTITKDHELAAPFVDAVNTFYGRGEIPVGVCKSGITPDQGKFIGLASQQDNKKPRYPHDLMSGKDAPGAVELLRKVLASAEDRSVVIVQVGFSTNLGNLLKSPGDNYSPLGGTELVARKVRLLSIMGGAFQKIRDKKGEPRDYREYNIIKDIPAARRIAEHWPTSIVWSGFEIGLNLPYPHESIEKDFGYVRHHPLAESYRLYIPPPHDRPTWDLTSVLYAVRPNRGYFELSPAGRVTVTKDGLTVFSPSKGGRDRYLMVRDQQKPRIIEALEQLSSQPPSSTGASEP